MTYSIIDGGVGASPGTVYVKFRVEHREAPFPETLTYDEFYGPEYDSSPPLYIGNFRTGGVAYGFYTDYSEWIDTGKKNTNGDIHGFDYYKIVPTEVYANMPTAVASLPNHWWRDSGRLQGDVVDDQTPLSTTWISFDVSASDWQAIKAGAFSSPGDDEYHGDPQGGQPTPGSDPSKGSPGTGGGQTEGNSFRYQSGDVSVSGSDGYDAVEIPFNLNEDWLRVEGNTIHIDTTSGTVTTNGLDRIEFADYYLTTQNIIDVLGTPSPGSNTPQPPTPASQEDTPVGAFSDQTEAFYDSFPEEARWDTSSIVDDYGNSIGSEGPAKVSAPTTYFANDADFNSGAWSIEGDPDDGSFLAQIGSGGVRGALNNIKAGASEALHKLAMTAAKKLLPSSVAKLFSQVETAEAIYDYGSNQVDDMGTVIETVGNAILEDEPLDESRLTETVDRIFDRPVAFATQYVSDEAIGFFTKHVSRKIASVFSFSDMSVELHQTDEQAFTDHRDFWFGRDVADTVRLGPNHDFAAGGGANDKLYGESGNDILMGNAGSDDLIGGIGRDVLLGQNGRDWLWGEGGRDIMKGGRGNDEMAGGAGDDKMFGQAGADQMLGGGARDRMNGQGGKDILLGEGGRDILRGGGGDDFMFGGAGRDTYIGGSGEDVFVMSAGRDVVRDFQPGSGDLVDFARNPSINDASSLFGQFLNETSEGALIDDRKGNTLLLKAVSVVDLNAADFVF